jgi:hypothetical protein
MLERRAALGHTVKTRRDPNPFRSYASSREHAVNPV